MIQQLKVADIRQLYIDSFNMPLDNEFDGQEVVNYHKCKNCNLHYFDPSSAGSPGFYEDLQHNRNVYYSPDRPEFFYAKEFVNKGDKVLEIGSGSGFFAEKIKDSNYIGLEFNDKAISDAAAKGITLLNKTVEQFAEDTDEEFDVVCSFHVLEHVTDPKGYLESSLNVLKKGGRLITAVPCMDSMMTNNVNHVLNMPPHHITRWSVATAKRIAEIYDLKVVAIHTEPLEERLRKNYFSNLVYNRILLLFGGDTVLRPKNDFFSFVFKVIHKFNSKLKLYKLFSNKKMLKPNMVFVFEKQ